MIDVTCRTNLDLAHERWPTELPAVPRVGDRIQSATKWEDSFRLQLQVVSVTWKCRFQLKGRERVGNWYPEIELHLQNMSILAFYEWYAPRVGRSVSAFI